MLTDEDERESNKETKKEILRARKEVEEGR